nr:hypothetical protein [Verrucomicrobiota bacterium]
MRPNLAFPLTLSRRRFLAQSTRAVAGLGVAGLAVERSAWAAGGDVIKLALVGCGGRGTGAAGQALSADPGVRLVAMADIFPHRLELSLSTLRAAHGDRVAVDPAAKFTEFDGYQQAIAAADVVI